MALLPVDEALARLLDGAEPKAPARVPLAEAAGRVLAEAVLARRTHPPFDASAMDGYAVRAGDIEQLPATLRIIGEAPAGRPFAGSVPSGAAVRIFTGAPVPDGADTVVIQENTEASADEVTVLHPTGMGRNIRPRGLDFSKGDTLLAKGRVMDAAAVSLAAAGNHPDVVVVGKPLVTIIATGDELLLPGSEPGPGQIISSNSFGIAAIAKEMDADILDLGIVRDDVAAIAERVHRSIAAGADVIVTLGGASVGDHDLVHEALIREGMALDFWQIAMRPGKPLMFGRLGATRCIGLPGNPVAGLVCSHLFLKPLLARLSGKEWRTRLDDAVLGAAMPANDHRQDYVRATVARADGLLVARPFKVQDSSMLRTFSDADALIVRKPHAPAAVPGEPCLVLHLR